MGAWRSHYHRTRAQEWGQESALEEAGLGQRQVGWWMVHGCGENGFSAESCVFALKKVTCGRTLPWNWTNYRCDAVGSVGVRCAIRDST